MKHIFYIVSVLALFFVPSISRASAMVDDDGYGQEQQRRATYYYLAAQKQKENGNISAMVDLLQHCLNIDPRHAAATYDMASVLFPMRRDSVAVAELKKAVEFDPNNPWYLETLATAYLQLRQPDNAIPILEQMAKLQSKRTDIQAELFQLYKQQGRTDDAIGALDRLQTLQGNSTRIAAQKFALYMDKNDTIQAFNALYKLCHEYPYDVSSMLLLANQYLEINKTDSAKILHQKVMRIDPHNSMLQTIGLQYLLAVGDTATFRLRCDSIVFDKRVDESLRVNILSQMISDAARDSLEMPHCDSIFNLILAEEKPPITFLQLYIAYRTYVYHDENEKILPIMQRILDIEPSNIEYIQTMMQYHIQQNDAEAIKKLCQQSLIYHPSEITFHYFLGMACAQLKQSNEAIQALTTAIRQTNEESNPLIVGDIYCLLGDLQHEAGHEKEAFLAYDSCLVYSPDNAACLNNYAYFLSLKNLQPEQLERAEEMSYRAIKAAPNNKTYLDTYAWVLFMCNDYTTARSYMDKVVDPAASDSVLLADDNISAVVIEHAGDICWHTNDVEQALRLWQLAAKKEKPSATLRKKIKKRTYIANTHHSNEK